MKRGTTNIENNTKLYKKANIIDAKRNPNQQLVIERFLATSRVYMALGKQDKAQMQVA